MTIKEAVRLGELHAVEEAERDLAFNGDKALQALPLNSEHIAIIRQGLLFYARNAAGRAIRFLGTVHGQFEQGAKE